MTPPASGPGCYIGRDGTNESRQATEIELIQFYCGL